MNDFVCYEWPGMILKQILKSVNKILNDCNWTWTRNHLVHERTLNHLAKLTETIVLWVLICTVHLTVCSCHAMYAFQSESTLYGCLKVKALLAQSRHKIWSLSDCNWTRTQNHLFHKGTLNHSAKLVKWLSYRVWIHSETRTWHDKNTQSNALYR